MSELLIDWLAAAPQWALGNPEDMLELQIDWLTAASQWALDNLEDVLELLQRLDWKAVAFENGLDDWHLNQPLEEAVNFVLI